MIVVIGKFYKTKKEAIKNLRKGYIIIRYNNGYINVAKQQLNAQ